MNYLLEIKEVSITGMLPNGGSINVSTMFWLKKLCENKDFIEDYEKAKISNKANNEKIMNGQTF